jgi:hypothetical protein
MVSNIGIGKVQVPSVPQLCVKLGTGVRTYQEVDKWLGRGLKINVPQRRQQIELLIEYETSREKAAV